MSRRMRCFAMIIVLVMTFFSSTVLGEEYQLGIEDKERVDKVVPILIKAIDESKLEASNALILVYLRNNYIGYCLENDNLSGEVVDYEGSLEDGVQQLLLPNLKLSYEEAEIRDLIDKIVEKAEALMNNSSLIVEDEYISQKLRQMGLNKHIESGVLIGDTVGLIEDNYSKKQVKKILLEERFKHYLEDKDRDEVVKNIVRIIESNMNNEKYDKVNPIYQNLSKYNLGNTILENRAILLYDNPNRYGYINKVSALKSSIQNGLLCKNKITQGIDAEYMDGLKLSRKYGSDFHKFYIKLVDELRAIAVLDIADEEKVKLLNKYKSKYHFVDDFSLWSVNYYQKYRCRKSINRMVQDKIHSAFKKEIEELRMKRASNNNSSIEKDIDKFLKFYHLEDEISTYDLMNHICYRNTLDIQDVLMNIHEDNESRDLVYFSVEHLIYNLNNLITKEEKSDLINKYSKAQEFIVDSNYIYSNINAESRLSDYLISAYEDYRLQHKAQRATMDLIKALDEVKYKDKDQEIIDYLNSKCMGFDGTGSRIISNRIDNYARYNYKSKEEAIKYELLNRIKYSYTDSELRDLNRVLASKVIETRNRVSLEEFKTYKESMGDFAFMDLMHDAGLGYKLNYRDLYGEYTTLMCEGHTDKEVLKMVYKSKYKEIAEKANNPDKVLKDLIKIMNKDISLDSNKANSTVNNLLSNHGLKGVVQISDIITIYNDAQNNTNEIMKDLIIKASKKKLEEKLDILNGEKLSKEELNREIGVAYKRLGIKRS